MVEGSGFRVRGSRFRVQGSGFRVQGSKFRVQGSGFMVQDSWLRVFGEYGVGPCTGVHIFTFAPKSRPIWPMCQSRPISIVQLK